MSSCGTAVQKAMILKKTLILALFTLFFGSYSSVQAQTLTSSPQELQEAKEFFDEFLETWLVKQDIDKAISHVSLDDEYKQALLESVEQIPQNFDLNLHTRKILVMFLVEDHGSLEALGHGNPNHPRYSELSINPTNLQSRIQPPNLSEVLILNRLEPSPEGDDYIAGVQLKHAPRDGLIFLLTKVNQVWKITLMMWTVA